MDARLVAAAFERELEGRRQARRVLNPMDGVLRFDAAPDENRLHLQREFPGEGEAADVDLGLGTRGRASGMRIEQANETGAGPVSREVR